MEQHRGEDQSATWCHAPFASMYLDQRGFARVCAANAGPPLGNVAHHTLREIWHGPVARDLRGRFSEGRWGAGCDLCRWQADATGDDQAFARVFDDVEPLDPPEWPTQLELAMGNTCNLQCVMCSGDQSSAIRRHREGFEPLPSAYPDRTFTELAELLPHLERAKFLGGEPFLVREHHRVWDLAIELGLDLPIHVTTNGTIWNDRVARVLEHLPTSLAVSVDGLRPETIAAVRVGADPEQLLANLDRFQAYARARGTYLSLTYCLMTVNWAELGDFLSFAGGRDLDVFVNTVLHPSRLSLYRLPHEELRRVVDHLDAQDAHVRGHLGRNLAVWDDQRERLRARLDAPAEAPRWLRPTSPDPVGTPVAPPGAGRTDDDERVLAAWAEDGRVVVLDLDADDRIVAVRPDGPGFLHLPIDVRGRSFEDLAMLLVSFYGRRTVEDVAAVGPALEEVHWRCETAELVTDLRTRRRAGRAGARRVVLAARRRPAPHDLPAAVRG